jgi:hypothetical protein
MRGKLEEVEPLVAAFADAYPWIPGFQGALAFVHTQTGEIERARAEVAQFSRDGFASIPLDGIWSVAVWALSFACADIGDAECCAQLYDLLSPHAGNLAGLGASLCLGSTHLPLGMLAAAAGDPSFEAHFALALDAHERLGARPFAAETRYRWGMAACGSSHSTELLRQALADAEALGMRGLAERCQSALGGTTRNT